ncbi:MAG TPA: hypothetical protein VFB12_02060 [Ktedonobacteraceae bacterium]|nr:hypothetical protein [Ktedonobacteraceae bacterium]
MLLAPCVHRETSRRELIGEETDAISTSSRVGLTNKRLFQPVGAEMKMIIPASA